MLLFPITGTWFNRITGIEPFEGESFKLVVCLLVCAEETFDVGFRSDSGRLRSGAKSRFLFGMDGDTHGPLQILYLKQFYACARAPCNFNKTLAHSRHA